MTQTECAQSITDLIAICDPAATPAERAVGLLRRFAGIVPHAAAAVTFVDPRTERHHLLANRGYPAPVVAYLLEDFVAHDRGWRRARWEPEAVLCWHDVPGYARAYSAREVFGAQGYLEGTSACLLGHDGRLVGAIHVSVREPDLPQAARASIVALRGTFATLAGTRAGQAASDLSARELEIVGLVADGLSNAEIAERLLIARRTVATHVEHVLAKLGARTRADAAVQAVRLGLV